MSFDNIAIPSPQELNKAITGKELAQPSAKASAVVEGRWENHASEVFELKSILAQSDAPKPEVPAIKESNEKKEVPANFIPPSPSELCPDNDALTLSDILESEDDEIDEDAINECVQTMLRPNAMLNDLLGKLF